MFRTIQNLTKIQRSLTSQIMTKYQSQRFICNTTPILCQQQSSTPPPSPSKEASSEKPKFGKRPTDFEKRVLVWTGRYPAMDKVPDFVTQEALERANNKFRIRIANLMMVLTIVGCVIMVISGKKAAERGESVSKMNLDWHKQYNEQMKPKEESSKK